MPYRGLQDVAGDDGATITERLELAVDGGRIEGVFSPVFPQGENAGEVAARMLRRPRRRLERT